jgi:hypothetical protein
MKVWSIKRLKSNIKADLYNSMIIEALLSEEDSNMIIEALL